MRFTGGLKYLFTLALSVPLVALSPLLAAQCEEPAAPTFPSVEDADLSDMETADRRMQDYVNETEEYLECLGPEQRKLQLDAILTKMKQVTSDYNTFAVGYRKSKTRELFSGSGE